MPGIRRAIAHAQDHESMGEALAANDSPTINPDHSLGAGQ